MALLICFMGIDGSGKTTLSTRLLESLEGDYGLKCRYSWVKFGFSIISILKNNKNAALSKRNKDNPYKLSSTNKIIQRLYLYYVLIEHWIQTIFNVKIPLMLGEAVVCDRYYYDSIVDIVINFDVPYEKAKKIFKYFFGLPKPDITFYIKIPEEIAYQRKQDIYTIDYLKNRSKIYSLLEKDYRVIPLDGTLSLVKLDEQIKYALNSYIDMS